MCVVRGLSSVPCEPKLLAYGDELVHMEVMMRHGSGNRPFSENGRLHYTAIAQGNQFYGISTC